MRQIGTVPNQRQARVFEDYLLTLGVKAMVEEEANGWSVWIYDEDHIERAKQELAGFRETPDDPIYQDVSATAAELRERGQKKNAAARKNRIDVRQRWSRPAAQSCPVTFAMIAISVIVAIVSQLGTQEEPLLPYLRIAPTILVGDHTKWEPDLGLESVRKGEVWRLVTPIFLHFGILHIVFNMLWLRDLGTAVEFRRGSLRFLLIVLSIAAASNLAQYFHTGPGFGGMSGVVFGLFGYIWIKSRCEPNSGFFLHPNTVFLMIAWFFLCMTGVVGAIANMAHGVGLVAGLILGYAPSLWRNLAS